MAIYLAATLNEVGPAAIMSASIFTIILFFLALASIPALFKDSAYLRETRSRWMPDWWKYITASIGGPALTYFVADFAGLEEPAGIAFFAFLLISYASSTVYLYRRHNRIGVP